MITLTAKINLISSDKDTLSGVTSNLLGNNISSEIGAILGSKKQLANPFIVGASKVGDGSTFSSGVDYFIGSEPSNSVGIFTTPYEITINGNNITSIVIEFDTLNNRHPHSIQIDSVTYGDDDAIFTIGSLTSVNTHTITIDNWNTPNYPLIISGIYVELSIDINRRNLISLDSTIFDRSDYKLPSYGIISNTGNLEFNDLNGEIREYAEYLLLTSDLKVQINLTDTLTNKSEPVAIIETESWDYDNDNRSVSVSLKDDLEEWQNIHIEGINYDPRNPNAILPNGTMEDLYKWLQEPDENGNYRTPQKYKMLAFGELDQVTQNILTSTKLQYPLLESGTLWEQWQKLCQVCGLYIYKNSQGNTTCSYTLGS